MLKCYNLSDVFKILLLSNRRSQTRRLFICYHKWQRKAAILTFNKLEPLLLEKWISCLSISWTINWIIVATIIRPNMLWCWPHLYHDILFDIRLNFEWMWVRVLCTLWIRGKPTIITLWACVNPLWAALTQTKQAIQGTWITPGSVVWDGVISASGNVTPHVTKHLDRCPLAKHWYWELSSRMNNKRMMRLKTQLATRASLWSYHLRPVLIWQCAVVAGLD